MLSLEKFRKLMFQEYAMVNVAKYKNIGPHAKAMKAVYSSMKGFYLSLGVPHFF